MSSPRHDEKLLVPPALWQKILRLGFVKGFETRYVMLTSENKTSVSSEDEKKMGQSLFPWEFPAKGSSYVLQVLQFIGEWAAAWIVGSSCWTWSERCGDGRTVSPCALPSSAVWFWQTLWITTFPNPTVPWPTTILLSKLSLPPLPARMVDLSTWRNKTRQNWLGKKNLQPQIGVDGHSPLAESFLSSFKDSFIFKSLFPWTCTCEVR